MSNMLTLGLLESSAKFVIDQLGPWQRESTYRDALAAELRSLGFSASTEVKSTVWYTPSGSDTPTAVGTHIADIVVVDPSHQTSVIEIKLKSSSTDAGLAQANAYKTSFKADRSFLVVCELAHAVEI